MLPLLGVIAATLGLLCILLLIHRAVRQETGSLERNSLVAVGVTIVLIAAFYVATHLPGAGH